MATKRKDFQAFEKQWSVIKAATRVARKEASGLLTPALLKRHIDASETLVLPNGNAGLTVSYSPEELKEFAKAIQKAKGKHKAHLAGIPLLHLEAMSSVIDHQNAKSIRASTLYKTNVNMLFFQATASGETVNAPRHYQVRIRLEEWGDQLADTGPYLQRAKRACVGRISFDCGCGRHQYWFRYLAGVGNYAVTPPGERDFPKIRNPKLTGCCCKHVLKTLKVLKSGSIHAILAKELERQAGAKGFLGQGRRFLKVDDLQKSKLARGSSMQDADVLAAYRDFQKAGQAFAKKVGGDEMRRKIALLEQDLRVRSARERALRSAIRAEKSKATRQLEVDQHKALVQRIKDALQMAKTFGLDRDKALAKFAEASGLAPEVVKNIIAEEAL